MKLFGLETADFFPDYAEEEWNLGTARERRSKLHSLAHRILEPFLDFSFFVTPQPETSQPNEADIDHALDYAGHLHFSSTASSCRYTKLGKKCKQNRDKSVRSFVLLTSSKTNW